MQKAGFGCLCSAWIHAGEVCRTETEKARLSKYIKSTSDINRNAEVVQDIWCPYQQPSKSTRVRYKSKFHLHQVVPPYTPPPLSPLAASIYIIAV